MSLNLRKQGTSVWTPIPNGALNIKRNGAWWAPKKAYIKRNGVWVDTGYQGKPNAPVMPVIRDEDWAHITVTANPASSGLVADTVRVQLLQQLFPGSVLQQQDVTPGANVSFNNLTSDTNYIIRAYGLLAGVSSNASPELHRRTGHQEQSTTQPYYDWGAYHANTIPTQIDGSSEYLPAGTFPGAAAVDGNVSTSWISDANPVSSYFEALRFGVGGNRRYTSFSVVGIGAQAVWLGIRTFYIEDHWLLGVGTGGGTPFNGIHNVATFQHTYWGSIGNGLSTKTFDFDAQQVVWFDVAVSNLQSIGGFPGYRGMISSVYYTYQDQEPFTRTIVTVPYAPNSAW